MLGKTLKDMTIEEKLGKGLLGTTYRAASGSSHSIVKILDHEDYYYLLKTTYSSKKVNLGAGGLHRFRQLGRDRDRYFLKTTEIRGRSIRDIIDSRDKVPLTRIIGTLKTASGILQQIHDRGVIHGGIKPGNVFVRSKGGATLADCGHSEIVRRLRPNAYMDYLSGKDGGSYLPPDYLNADQEPDKSCDTYGLGVLLYALLLHCSLIPGDAPGQVKLDLDKAKKELPADLSAIIHKATGPKSKDRYKSASEFLGALNELDEEALKEEFAKIYGGGGGAAVPAGSMELEEFDLELDEPEEPKPAKKKEIFSSDVLGDVQTGPKARQTGQYEPKKIDSAPAKPAEPAPVAKEPFPVPASDPFAAKDPFSTGGDAFTPPSGDDPFAPKAMKADPKVEDPFAPASPKPPAAKAPAGADPFAPDSGSDPFGAPAVDPFAPSSGADPFASPGGPGDDPFASPAGADPFASPGDDPFAAPAGGEDPFAAPAGGDPFAAPAGGEDPFAPPAGGDPFAAPAGGDPFAPPSGVDPFAEPKKKEPPIEDPFADFPD